MDIREMYSLSQRGGSGWGVEGYEVPVDHFDQVKKKTNDILYKQAIGKAKRPKPKPVDMKAQRGGIFKEVER
jgi:hypothetical protein